MRHLAEEFIKLIGRRNVVTDPDILASANADWTRKRKGRSELLLTPENTEHVQQVVQFCHRQGIPLVAQGGNTGLVNGTIAGKEEVILSTVKLHSRIEFDGLNRLVVADAGFTLQQLQEAAGELNLCVPVDLGSKGTARLGGLLACNAGGMSFIRYGSLRSNCRGLGFVDGLGQHHDMMRSTGCAKDNTGYGLKDLIIGKLDI